MAFHSATPVMCTIRERVTCRQYLWHGIRRRRGQWSDKQRAAVSDCPNTVLVDLKPKNCVWLSDAVCTDAEHTVYQILSCTSRATFMHIKEKVSKRRMNSSAWLHVKSKSMPFFSRSSVTYGCRAHLCIRHLISSSCVAKGAWVHHPPSQLEIFSNY